MFQQQYLSHTIVWGQIFSPNPYDISLSIGISFKWQLDYPDLSFELIPQSKYILIKSILGISIPDLAKVLALISWHWPTFAPLPTNNKMITILKMILMNFLWNFPSLSRHNIVLALDAFRWCQWSFWSFDQTEFFFSGSAVNSIIKRGKCFYVRKVYLFDQLHLEDDSDYFQ